MTATRSRKEENTYKKHLKTTDAKSCPFCAAKKQDRDFYEETKSFKIIKNIFPYSIWDGQTVIDHLMVTPKKHTDNLAGMTNAQKVEYVSIIEKYEKRGYNIYSRAPVSVIKSIAHQHTHLIKTKGAAKRFLFLLRRPFYIRVVR
jgi:diadenosine tetraphosphate (Ap4A) HIT family hydrolase